MQREAERREALVDQSRRPSLIELLLAMPDCGEDADFERRRDPESRRPWPNPFE